MVVVVRPPVVGAAVVVPVSGGLADGLREARDAKRDADRTRKLHGDDDVVVSHLLTLTRSMDGCMIAGSCDGRRHGARENVRELRRRRRALNIGGFV